LPHAGGEKAQWCIALHFPLTGAFGATSPQPESKSRANARRFAAFAHAYAAFRKRNGREA